MLNALRFFLMVLCCIWSASCGSMAQARPSAPLFRDYYDKLVNQPSPSIEAEKREKKITFSADGIPLSALLRQLADDAGVSIIAHQSLDKSLVTLEAKNANITEVLASIARRLDQRLSKIGSTWFLGPLQPEDRGCLVRRVARLDAEQLAKVLESFKSEIGRANAFSDGVIVVADRVEVLERLNLALDQLEQVPANSWVVQYYLVTLNNKAKFELGITTDYQAKFTANLVSNAPSSKLASLSLNALLASTYENSGSRLLGAPLLVVRDGSTAVLNHGVEIRLPKLSTSPYGTTETTGYEVINTGFSLKTIVRDDTTSKGHLTVDLQLGEILSYVNDLPQIARETFQTDCAVASGGVYLLGSLDLGTKTRSATGTMGPTNYAKNDDQTSLYLWARTFKISSSVRYEAASSLSSEGDATGSTGEAPASAGGPVRR